MPKIAIIHEDTFIANNLQKGLEAKFSSISIQAVNHTDEKAWKEFMNSIILSHKSFRAIIIDIPRYDSQQSWRIVDMLVFLQSNIQKKIPLIVCIAELTEKQEINLEKHKVYPLLKPFDVDDLHSKIKTCFESVEEK